MNPSVTPLDFVQEKAFEGSRDRYARRFAHDHYVSLVHDQCVSLSSGARNCISRHPPAKRDGAPAFMDRAGSQTGGRKNDGNPQTIRARAEILLSYVETNGARGSLLRPRHCRAEKSEEADRTEQQRMPQNPAHQSYVKSEECQVPQERVFGVVASTCKA